VKRRQHRAWLIALVLLWTGYALAGDDPQAELLEILQRFNVDRQAVGLYIEPLDASNPIELDADRPRHPASVIKLLTTLAALEILGPTYTWRTDIYASTPTTDGTIDGDLVLKGGGDPFLVTEQFWKMLKGLRDRGVRHIGGDLVLDDTFFANTETDRSAFDEKPYRAYNVPPYALLVNFGVTRFVIRPQLAANAIRVFADPPATNLIVDNQMTPQTSGCPRPSLRFRHKSDTTTVTLTGSYALTCREFSLYRSVMPHAQYVAGVFKALWHDLGGTLRGGVRIEPNTSGQRLLHSHESQTLAESIRHVNKFSNNVMARQVLSTIAAHRFGAPGTTANGIAAINEWLATNELHMPELVLDNGAGLSRVTRISPRNLGRVLAVGIRSTYQPELVASLPLLAADGALTKRLPNAAVNGRIRVKTGLVDHVRSLAGYVTARSGRRFIVVLMLNQHDIHRVRGARAQDAVLRWLLEQ
jgi:D-alanyl-D-alanine carboxypeptidase/D-alanyl-D-alanine-endopeptidase (penicillin-binding protein 4)